MWQKSQTDPHTRPCLETSTPEASRDTAARRGAVAHPQARPAPRPPGAPRPSPRVSRTEADARSCALTSPLRRRRRHTSCALAVPASDRSRAELGDITQLPRQLQSLPGGQRGTWRARRGHNSSGRRAGGPRLCPLPILPRWRSRDWSPARARAAQIQSRSSSPSPSPGSSLPRPDGPPDCQGRTATSSRWRVSTTRGSLPPAISWAVWVPVPGAAGGHRPGNARPFAFPFSTPWVDCARLPIVSGSPPRHSAQAKAAALHPPPPP